MHFVDERSQTDEEAAPHQPTPSESDDRREAFLPDLRADDLMFGLFRRGVWIHHPVFCFSLFGRTETRLPDGRIVYIGGEHEEFYDHDFCIYSEVVVVSGQSVKPEKEGSEEGSDYGEHPELAELEKKWREEDREREEERKREKVAEDLKQAASVEGARPKDIEVYGYPVDVFPPTDFHTATYYKDERSGKGYIFIIGGLGYGNSAHRKAILTHRLNLEDFGIRRIHMTGDPPPPRHSTNSNRDAELVDDTIRLRVEEDEYILDLTRMRWDKVQLEVLIPSS
ncbi:hypothetical protein VTI74DRAFT_8407 [Chaetomium olivicolor]